MISTERIDIQQYLPHRNPLLMVDYIIELHPDKVVTTFKIEEGNIFLQNNQFSESGLIEHTAQSCATIVGQQLYQASPDVKVIGYITTIKKLAIFRLPSVGTEITSKASLVSIHGDICHIYCETFHQEDLLLQTEITLLIQSESA